MSVQIVAMKPEMKPGAKQINKNKKSKPSIWAYCGSARCITRQEFVFDDIEQIYICKRCNEPLKKT